MSKNFAQGPTTPLLPGAMLGVVGGGQLGRMFAHAATQMGYHVTVLDPAETGPAAEVATQHLRFAYDDPEGLAELALTCDAVTTEFENVPADSLRFLQQHIPVSPSPEAVEVAQSRIREKTFFKNNSVPTNHFALVKRVEDIDAAFAQMSGKAVIKTTQLGYDGKGQRVCDSAAEVREAFLSFGSVECLLEDFIPFDLEVSVVLARDWKRQIEVFPLVENQHCNGILDVCIVPARVSGTVSDKALSIARKLADALDYVGVLAVEMFVTGDQVLVNEIAPRPHNSGHYTLDATSHSQFDQQVRTLCGLSAATVKLHQPVVMLNVLGDLVLDEKFSWEILCADSSSHLHVYGKHEARAARKMAHVNYLGDSPDELIARVENLKRSFTEVFSIK